MDNPQKKLYRVEVSFTLYVLAEDDWEARDLGREHASEETADEIFASPVTQVSHIDPEWRDSLPYGTKDDKTCAKIVEAAPAPPYNDPHQQKLFG